MSCSHEGHWFDILSLNKLWDFSFNLLAEALADRTDGNPAFPLNSHVLNVQIPQFVILMVNQLVD
jgi:hypothetical protein